MRTALSIAGSDSSGGAGIQADLKTMTMNGVFGMSAVTALTAQNTTGVTGIMEVTPEFLKQQLEAVFEDIFPDAVKIGMVSNGELIRVIGECLKKYGAKNIVAHPVMVATSGSKLMKTEAIAILQKEIFPLADLVTPNIPEAEILAGISIKNVEDMKRAAKSIGDAHGCAVLVKGGHSLNDANDLLYQNGTGGLKESGSITRIPMERDVLYQALLLRIWQKDFLWRTRWNGQRYIFPERWKLCWIWERVTDR